MTTPQPFGAAPRPGTGGNPATPVAPRLYRCTNGRWLGGVASALADYLNVPRLLVRFGFVLLSFAGGMGVLLYGAFWIVLKVPPQQYESSRRSAVEYLVAVLAGGGVLLINARTLPLGWWFLPSVLACFGGALLWRQASESERDRWRRLSRSSLSAGALDRVGLLRLVAGVTLVLAGGVIILAQAGISAVGVGLAAMLVTAVGIGLITGPWWLRLVHDLSAERSERIRSEERADIAAHLHDSVLQTLALIQRNASSPREVSRLARIQERELRTKLYGAGVPNGQFGAALYAAAAEVEDTYAVTVDVVLVGDRALDTRLDALVAAAREALINSARHAQVTAVSLYGEVTEVEAVVFVRDRGIGFDPSLVDSDRQGVRGSIIGRMERQHGQADIRSAPGAGTEVALKVGLA
ncbi:ATP-binding protein [soil metagenome]